MQEIDSARRSLLSKLTQSHLRLTAVGKGSKPPLASSAEKRLKETIMICQNEVSTLEIFS